MVVLLRCQLSQLSDMVWLWLPRFLSVYVQNKHKVNSKVYKKNKHINKNYKKFIQQSSLRKSVNNAYAYGLRDFLSVTQTNIFCCPCDMT